MTKQFILYDLEGECIVAMTMAELLDEINRDRSEEWQEYTEEDWQEGWNEWCEGDVYKLLKIKQVATIDDVIDSKFTSEGRAL